MIGYILAIAIPVIIVLFIHFWTRRRSNFTQSSTESPPAEPKPFKGLVLFDVDGTLTTGQNNEEVIQAVLDQGWAVGISTAGAIYNMGNLHRFHWMPKNLYDFMKTHNSITFNNVASGYLTGKFNRVAYNKLETHSMHPMMAFGYRKGFSLVQTGKALGITNPKCLILCDDMSGFMEGALVYNQDLGMVCSGANCGGHLSVQAVQNEMNKCP